MILEMKDVLLFFFFFLALMSKATIRCAKLHDEGVNVIIRRQIISHEAVPVPVPLPPHSVSDGDGHSYCLSWRLGVETNNIRAWRTVPPQCLRHIETYMIGGQYEHDMNLIIDNIITYIDAVPLSDDGLDAWVLDVDDTLISNLFYYKGKRFGCDPYDPLAFKTWALKRVCPAIPGAQRLFNKLVETGFKVFIVTGRDQQTLGQATLDNLQFQGFSGYERLILRTEDYRGVGAVTYKSEMRKKLVGQGYRILGNVGDQWSDLQGEVTGNRTFKLPNPMYFVP